MLLEPSYRENQINFLANPKLFEKHCSASGFYKIGPHPVEDFTFTKAFHNFKLSYLLAVLKTLNSVQCNISISNYIT